jgi:hypothetical protein
MRSILSERNIVVLLFVLVLITFSLAHEDTKKMEQLYQGVNSSATISFHSFQQHPAVNQEAIIPTADQHKQ